MNKIPAFIAAAILAMSFYPSFVDAEQLNIKDSFRIKLAIEASNDAQTNMAKSYISRELRKLGDVLIVDENYEYKLEILIMNAHSKGGVDIGLVVSSIISSAIRKDTIDAIRNIAKIEDKVNILYGLIGYGMNIDHMIRTGNSGDLEAICARLVTSFDVEILERSRKSRQ